MKAIQCEAFGPLEDLVFVDAPVPEAGPGQVRIRVRAAGVNFLEGITRCTDRTDGVSAVGWQGAATEA